MKPTLFLLAAGMGSRYGGLKQLDELGPHGETIMDYSIYDAINAGFGKLVFVIRKDFEDDFRRIVLSKYEGHIPCELVELLQSAVTASHTCSEEEKCWFHNSDICLS
jgi:CTP:molybdopterin cytidylyltransferase MocA